MSAKLGILNRSYSMTFIGKLNGVVILSPQVMQVVREQITRTLSSKPTSLELFKNKVNALNYSEILKLRQTERLHQEETLAPPVV